MLLPPYGLWTVSYTHLDVYKRQAMIGGCTGTSNVLAGQLFDVPVKGTHAHSWITVSYTHLVLSYTILCLL